MCLIDLWSSGALRNYWYMAHLEKKVYRLNYGREGMRSRELIGT